MGMRTSKDPAIMMVGGQYRGQKGVWMYDVKTGFHAMVEIEEDVVEAAMAMHKKRFVIFNYGRLDEDCEECPFMGDNEFNGDDWLFYD